MQRRLLILVGAALALATTVAAVMLLDSPGRHTAPTTTAAPRMAPPITPPVERPPGQAEGAGPPEMPPPTASIPSLSPEQESGYWSIYGVDSDNPYASYDLETVRAIADGYDPMANEWLAYHLFQRGQLEEGQERIIKAVIYSGRWEPLLRMFNNFLSEYAQADVALKYLMVAKDLGAPLSTDFLEKRLSTEQIDRNRQEAEKLLERIRRERFALFGKGFPGKGEDDEKDTTDRGAARQRPDDRSRLWRAGRGPDPDGPPAVSALR